MTTEQAMHLAVQHFQAKRVMESAAMLKHVLATEPNHADALNLLGIVTKTTGDANGGIELIRQAIRANPNVVQFYNNLAVMLLSMNRRGEALDAFDQALRLSPDNAQAHANLGALLREEGRLEESIASTKRAILLQPNIAEAYGNLGSALGDLGRYEEAIDAIREAIRLRPTFASAHYNLGLSLLEMGKPDDAAAAFSEAIRLNPHYYQACCDLGNIYRQKGNYSEAVNQYMKAISYSPTYATAHWNLALTDLLLGNFSRGWAEYEWRTGVDGIAKPLSFSQPQWKGEDIAGKTIILHSEQGFGDTIQFCRYAPLVAARGAKVVALCQPELVRLLQSMEGVSEVIARGATLPAFDLHCPFLSLPVAFKTELGTVPAKVPYLHATFDASRFAVRSDRLKVGIAWAGRPTHKLDHLRSIPLSMFDSLARDDIQFVSLQKGDPGQQSSRFELISFTDQLLDFDDTASLIEGLDLVITVDTAIAHLAGALGKPVWILLQWNPDWRWLLDRRDSPWYPTARIFRQPISGDWESVFKHVSEELKSHIAINTEVYRG